MDEAAESQPDKSPRAFGLPAPWRIGHLPVDAEDWALETRIRLSETEKDREWSTGRRPETDREWELEYSFRELNSQESQQSSSGGASDKPADRTSAAPTQKAAFPPPPRT